MFRILALAFCMICFFSCTEKKSGNNTPRKATKNNVAEVETKKTTNAQTTVDPAQLEKAKALLADTDPAAIADLDGAKLYKMHCAICHGFKGDMKVNGAKDLTISKIPLEEAVAQVYHGKGLMQPYKGILSDAEIIAVANFCETLRK